MTALVIVLTSSVLAASETEHSSLLTCGLYLWAQVILTFTLLQYTAMNPADN